MIGAQEGDGGLEGECRGYWRQQLSYESVGYLGGEGDK